MSNTVKLAIISILFLLTAFGAFIVFANNDSESENNPSKSTSTSTSTVQDISKISPDKLMIGNPEAKVTIIEYADFKCPQCGKFHQTSGKQLRQEYIDSGQANIEVRSLPKIGPDSARALRGAYCANDQGAFVGYHDDLFNYMWENYYKNGDYAISIQDNLTENVLTDIATRAGADKTKFAKCIATTEKNKLIDRDLERAVDDDVEGPPTFIIGDQKVVGPLPFNNFKTLIDINLRSN